MTNTQIIYFVKHKKPNEIQKNFLLKSQLKIFEISKIRNRDI